MVALRIKICEDFCWGGSGCAKKNPRKKKERVAVAAVKQKRRIFLEIAVFSQIFNYFIETKMSRLCIRQNRDSFEKASIELTNDVIENEVQPWINSLTRPRLGRMDFMYCHLADTVVDRFCDTIRHPLIADFSFEMHKSFHQFNTILFISRLSLVLPQSHLDTLLLVGFAMTMDNVTSLVDAICSVKTLRRLTVAPDAWLENTTKIFFDKIETTKIRHFGVGSKEWLVEPYVVAALCKALIVMDISLLDLNRLPVRRREFIKLCSTFPKMKNLYNLHIEQCAWTSKGLEKFFHVMNKCKTLTILNISRNNITHHDLTTFTQVLRSNRKLKVLYAYSEKLTLQQVTKFVDDVMIFHPSLCTVSFAVENTAPIWNRADQVKARKRFQYHCVKRIILIMCACLDVQRVSAKSAIRRLPRELVRMLSSFVHV